PKITKRSLYKQPQPQQAQFSTRTQKVCKITTSAEKNWRSQKEPNEAFTNSHNHNKPNFLPERKKFAKCKRSAEKHVDEKGQSEALTTERRNREDGYFSSKVFFWY
ncbi:MAG: hypothetical protein J6Q47_00865, partial [Paludibacteraceae bacterium]|nr:hypothetical protein [Paludibacteraceae bacterium]